jgi:hypothetical protein
MEDNSEEANPFPVVFNDNNVAHHSSTCDDVPQTDPGGAGNNCVRGPAGRSIGVCWEFLSTELNQQRQMQTRCKSCLMMVRHHKKSERVKAHLNACIPFRRTFADVASSDVPDWIILQGRAQHTKGMSQSKSNTSISLLTTPAKKKSRTMKDYILPALSKTEYTAFEADLAMHYYMTGTSFARMEEPHFLEAFKNCAPTQSSHLKRI